jgi:PhzF family phenazine biosynthesis protein
MAQIFHVDVFSARAFYGNPLAVILMDAQTQPSTESMQRIAAWLNLSETTFARAAPDRLSYSVRIFTPKQELPFAGHPSIGTAAALFAAGALSNQYGRTGDTEGTLRAGQYTQHCGAGALPVWRDQSSWFVRAPIASVCNIDSELAAQLAQICGAPLALSGAPPAVVTLGPRWAVAEFASCVALLKAQPDFGALSAWNRSTHNLGLAAFARGEDDAGPYLEVRCFVPLDGIAEDPVTGSGNAAIAAFLHFNQAFGTLPRHYRARQGRAIGRDGRLELIVSDSGEIAVGGAVTLLTSGEIDIGL